jgi:hypothetical protein
MWGGARSEERRGRREERGARGEWADDGGCGLLGDISLVEAFEGEGVLAAVAATG